MATWRNCALSALMVAMVWSCAAPVEGSLDVDVGSTISLANGAGGSNGVNGGRFAVTGSFSGGGPITAFETFCGETSERISLGSAVYTVTAISTSNSSGTGLLNGVAAWAYTQFRNMTLLNFDYAGANQEESANALQQLIWGQMGMSPLGTLGAVGQSLLNDWIGSTNPTISSGYGGAYAASGWGTSLGSVRVAQLVDASGGDAQDQLVMVPEAASLAIWGLLAVLGAVGSWRWRRGA